MTKRLLKGFWAAGFIAVLAAVAVPAEAADISCTVPFSFSVHGKTLPPGDYSISTGFVQGAVFVRGFDHGALALATRLSSSSDSDPKLVFHKYGDQYVLSQVWLGGVDGRQLPTSRLERELRERNSKVSKTFERVVIPAL